MTAKELAPDRRKFFLDHCPTGRAGDVSEVAAAVLYLASDAAGFVNGQALHLDGGLGWFP